MPTVRIHELGSKAAPLLVPEVFFHNWGKHLFDRAVREYFGSATAFFAQDEDMPDGYGVALSRTSKILGRVYVEIVSCAPKSKGVL